MILFRRVSPVLLSSGYLPFKYARRYLGKPFNHYWSGAGFIPVVMTAIVGWHWFDAATYQLTGILRIPLMVMRSLKVFCLPVGLRGC